MRLGPVVGCSDSRRVVGVAQVTAAPLLCLRPAGIVYPLLAFSPLVMVMWRWEGRLWIAVAWWGVMQHEWYGRSSRWMAAALPDLSVPQPTHATPCFSLTAALPGMQEQPALTTCHL